MGIASRWKERRELWESLKQLKNMNPDGIWCLMGDFNSIRNTSEREKSFRDAVSNCWSQTSTTGWGGFVLKEKIKQLKQKLKLWHKEQSGGTFKKVQELEEEINKLEIESAERQLSHEECMKRKMLQQDLWLAAQSHESIMRQKARLKWVKEGDYNFRYFHLMRNSNRRSNAVNGVHIEGVWVDEPAIVKAEIFRFFQQRYQEPELIRPKLNGVSFKSIGQQQNQMLVGCFSEEEIKRAVWECGSEKSPGPDGLNFKFIKQFWHILKLDIIRFLYEFHANGIFPKGGNASFIALLPKVPDPQNLYEFRPISLIGCVYKIVAKLLANRLKRIMPDIIDERQSAFVAGRQLLHSAIIANEVVEEAKRRKKSCLVFKADFERAYDSVSWDFLIYMMPEALAGLMREAINRNIYTAFAVGKNSSPVSFLQYADDTIFFGEATIQNIKAIKAILRGFEIASSLKINFAKSSLMVFGKSDQWTKEAAKYLNCISLAFHLFGYPYWGKPKALLPNKVPEKLITIQRKFLWGRGLDQRKIAWVKWESICLPKEKGGLGIKDVRNFNKALLGKWKWDMIHQEKELWVRILESKYGGWRSLAEGKRGTNESLWWQDLMVVTQDQQLNNMMQSGLSWNVGSGDKIKFWEDCWTGEGVALMQKFPRLYQISRQQHNLIQQVGNFSDTSWKWKLSWRRQLFDNEADSAYEFMRLISQLGHLEGEDQDGALQDLWKLKIPAKASIFAWRLIKDRLPTKSNLHRRQVVLEDSLCSFCRIREEDASHIFLECIKIRPLWWESQTWVWGTAIMQKRYRETDYLLAFVVTLGCSVFILYPAGTDISPYGRGRENTVWGVLLMLGYLGCDGFTSTFQDKMFKGYNMEIHNQIFYTTLSSCILSLTGLIIQGHLLPAVEFVYIHKDCFFDIALLSTVATASQFFISYTIRTFGALTFATIMTTRQLVSILLSCVWFAHPLSWQQWIGAVIVFGAIYAKSFLRKAPEKTTSVEHVQNGNGNSNNLKENP
ncbi:UDP-galactose/UDP-glucose transporter 5 [Glycine soja]|uniref:UDP-galactose/UDP-glucose transporter 5 n=1 Tax=Glycine soja TaxID=3848 RepID=A0A445I1N3_GLYSO|nr:UDP-galactose/UDP-glucose transporter 5 [Glycine soja]